MSRHLITGGAGFIGSALAHRLIAEGHEVTILDRFSRGKHDRVPKGAQIVEGDIRQRDHVFLAARKVDVIWHLAYVQGTQTFYADPKDVIDVALRGIMNVLWVCELRKSVNGKAPELVLLSSSEVYQEPPEGMYPTDESVPLSVPDVTNPRYSYGGGKIASELAVMAYAQAGVLDRAVIVRPHNVYGPDMGHEHVIPQFAERMLDKIATEAEHEVILPFPIQGTGQESRSFCYIDDCIDGLMIAHERGSSREVYHLGNPREAYSIEELAHEVAHAYGADIDVVPGELPQGSPKRRRPDIGKLQALGFRPNVCLNEGLDSTLRWYKTWYNAHNAELSA